MAFFQDSLDDLFALERTGRLKDFFNDAPYNAGLISPLRKRIQSPSHKNEASVLDKLVVNGRLMRLLLEFFFDALCHFPKVHRRAVITQDKIGEISNAPRFDVGRVGYPPIAKRIFPDLLRKRKPASRDI